MQCNQFHPCSPSSVARALREFPSSVTLVGNSFERDTRASIVLRVATVDDRASRSIGVLENKMPLSILLVHAAEVEGQERVDKVVGREHLEIRQGTLGNVCAMRNGVGEQAGGGNVD